jgi:amino-acid N-acetyltransferase
MIRAATIHDVPRIQAIINSHAELGKMLFKSLAQLFEDIRDFGVYEDRGPDGCQPGKVVGCVALTIIWGDLAEVRSLAVDESCRGRGIGKQLVQWCVDEARRLHIRRLFALTYEDTFFRKLDFDVVDKDTLPLKVWSDCVRCPKRDGCDEIAVVRTLTEIPEFTMEAAPRTPRGVSIPVLE